MKLIILSFAFLFYSAAFAQDINGRINVSKKIMKIYEEDCQIESEKIKETFELAATYIIHGEYNNMIVQQFNHIHTNTMCLLHSYVNYSACS